MSRQYPFSKGYIVRYIAQLGCVPMKDWGSTLNFSEFQVSAPILTITDVKKEEMCDMDTEEIDRYLLSLQKN